jgi:hypothetical protein
MMRARCAGSLIPSIGGTRACLPGTIASSGGRPGAIGSASTTAFSSSARSSGGGASFAASVSPSTIEIA